MNGWPQRRIKYVASINGRSLAENEDPELRFRYIDIATVGRGHLLVEPAETTFHEAPSRARRLVSEGDTIVSTVRTYLRAVWPVVGQTDDLVVSTGFAVLTPKRDLDPRYLGWWAQSDPFVEEVVGRSVGVSYPAINALEIGDLAMPLPPIEAQREIADFLDAETARINALIDKKRRMIEALRLQRQAYLDQMLLGVGQPVRLRRLVGRVTSGPRGWSELVAEEGVLFLRITNVSATDVELDTGDTVRVQAPEGAERERTMVRSGDVLVSITAEIGSVGVARAEHDGAAVSQHIALITPSACSGDWLALSLTTSQAKNQMDAARYGGTKTQLSLDDVRNTVIEVVDSETEARILSRLKGWLGLQRLLGQTIRRQIDLLIEHRQALITAAVMGDCEMAGVAA